MATISVAMCSYNGERYIREQLDSIAAQTRLPDEVVVVDDCSRDATVEIVTAFAAAAPMPVRLVVNEHNLGFVKNFEKAVGLCEGEIIVLSDQDDVWRADKLAMIEAAFANFRVGAVFTDAELVDEKLQPLPYRLWEAVGFRETERAHFADGGGFGVLVRYNVVTGATLAFRRSYRELALPIPDCWYHDGWIALLVAAVGEVAMIPEPLIKYRQHGKNQIGAKKKSRMERLVNALGEGRRFYERELAQFQAAHERLTRFHPELTEQAELLQEKIAHLRMRAELPRNRLLRIAPILREINAGGYARFSAGISGIIRDLLV